MTFRSFALGLILLAAVGGCQSNKAGDARQVTLRGNPVTLAGPDVGVGDKAPAFTAVANDMSAFNFNPGGNVWIISSVPSVDTPVCSAQTRRFNEEAAKLGPGVKVVTISMDLPFAQKRWCGAEGIANLQTVSDFRDRDFGQKYGLRIQENGLLARSVYVIGRDGRVLYRQIVPEITQEPDYAPILAAARAAAG